MLLYHKIINNFLKVLQMKIFNKNHFKKSTFIGKIWSTTIKVKFDQQLFLHIFVKKVECIKFFISYPNIKFPRKYSFRNSECINKSSDYVKEGHQTQPSQGRKVNGVVKSFNDYVVHGWNNSTQTQSDEHTYKTTAIWVKYQPSLTYK